MKKKLVICMLSATMALSLSMPTFAKDTKENVKVTAGETDVQSSLSGTCGENVKWNLNRNTHSLTITGTDSMRKRSGLRFFRESMQPFRTMDTQM